MPEGTENENGTTDPNADADTTGDDASKKTGDNGTGGTDDLAAQLEGAKTRLHQVNEEAKKHRLDASANKTRVAELESKIAELEQTNSDLTTKLGTAEDAKSAASLTVLRMRIGREHGLPDELADRLQGDDEDALKEDAKRLAAVARTDGTRNPLAAGHGSAGTNPNGDAMSPSERMSRAYANTST